MSRTPNMMRWIALSTGGAGLLALVFIVLFFTVGGLFGTLNDIFNGLAAVLSAALASSLHPQHRAQAPGMSRVALVSAIAGALAAAVGSALIIFDYTGWYLAGLYTSMGYALIGLWLFALNYSARESRAWPRGLATFGMIIGAIMMLGFAALPGIFEEVDVWDSAPWYLNYVALPNALGWLGLYPAWSIWLGRPGRR